MLIKKGSIFLVTEGEYPDWQVDMLRKIDMLCEAIIDIDVMALRSEYLVLYPEQSSAFLFNESQFCKWLVIDKKACKKIDYFDWQLGEYPDVDFSVDYHKAIGGTTK